MKTILQSNLRDFHIIIPRLKRTRKINDSGGSICISCAMRIMYCVHLSRFYLILYLGLFESGREEEEGFTTTDDPIVVAYAKKAFVE